MNTYIKIFVIFLFLQSIITADKYDILYKHGSEIFHKIKKDKIPNTHKNWYKAISYFKKITLKAPNNHPKKVDAYFSIGLCYIQTENFLKAIQNFRTLIKKYPNHRLSDDAQYLIGYCFLQINNIKQAKIEFKRVIRNYPKGDMLKKALSQLDILYKKYPDKKHQIKFYKYLIENFKDEYIRYEYTKKLNELTNEQQQDTLFQKQLKIKPKYEKGKPKFLKLRISSSEISSRIVLEFDQNVHYKINYIKDKNILFIDFVNSIINIKPINKLISNGLIKRIKLAQFNKKTVRLVIYLEKKLNYHIFSLNNPARVVIDISKSIIKKYNDNLSLINQLGLKISTVAIDPGHGGKDPGTIYGKYYEKDIVFNIAKYLLKLFNKDPEFQAFLTRNNDIFIPLEKRTEIANSRNADLFISLHVNFCENKHISGIETYYLSLTSDPWSQKLAALENASTLHKLSELKNLLQDIIINNKIEESKNFAFYVHNTLIKTLKSKNRKVRKAPFVVLIGSDMPAILIEVGYLSNKYERKKLVSHKYQQRIAKAIYKGIKKYQTKLNYVTKGAGVK